MLSMPYSYEDGDYTKASVVRAMEALRQRAPEIDAVFAANDLMAAGSVDVLRAKGRRIPEDVAVDGFDDAPVASSCDSPLATIGQPFARISAENGPPSSSSQSTANPPPLSTLPTERIVRASAEDQSQDALPLADGTNALGADAERHTRAGHASPIPRLTVAWPLRRSCHFFRRT
jgi:DNA-binding LacI/PurR family transcriptional regulator